jgi:hypothetical protein
MRFYIEPQRDLGLIDQDLGGWKGILEEGETKFEKTSEDRAEIFALFSSDKGIPGTSTLIDDFPTRQAAEVMIERLTRTRLIDSYNNPVPVLGYGLTRDGKVSIVESYRIPEIKCYGVKVGPCLCRQALRDGIAVMCMFCSGPEEEKTLMYTNGDL